MTKRSHTHGFTLVELSIVLVIIGLIVGGVVGGQSLVRSAQIQSIIKDFNKYKTAVNAFELQYDALPGDFSEAEDYWGSAGSDCWNDAGTGTETCNGDGDGAIDYQKRDIALHWSDNSYESWRAWEHLQNAEIINTSLTGIPTNAANANGQNRGNEAGVNSPNGAFEHSIFSLFYVSGSIWHNKNTNVVAFGSTKGSSYEGLWFNPVLTPAEAKKIDTKFDDGMPYSGIVFDIGNYGSENFTPDCTTGSSTSSAYDVSFSTAKCILMMEL
jgi:prepilin-type N-terminal cleavage/methylation domain-containing protein